MDLLIAEYKGQGRFGYVNLRVAKSVLLSFRPDCRLCDIDKRFCADATEWTKKAEDLAGRFIKNFGKYTTNAAGMALVVAGPKLK